MERKCSGVMVQIDILLATYNGENYIEEQINSILKQTYQNFRLLISDDCSQDETISIIEKIAENDKRIILYKQEKNIGYVRNFEFLLTKVKNDIYMLSDQDDVWLPDKIEKSYQKLIHEQADLVFTDLEVVDKELNTLYDSFNKHMKLYKKIIKTGSCYKSQYLYNTVTGCTIMSKKKFINFILPIPKESQYIIHDTWIGLIVSIKGKIVYLDEVTVKYRQHVNNQIGARKKDKKLKRFDDIRNLFIDSKIELFSVYVENASIFPEELQQLNVYALEYFRNVKTKKHINFKSWKTFYILYKNESFIYFLINFFIMNFPGLTRVLFKFKGVI